MILRYLSSKRFDLIVVLILVFGNVVSAQIRDVAYSFSVQPTISNRLMIFKGNQSQHYKDSIEKMDRSRDAIGASLLWCFRLSKKRNLYTGLQFHNFGFTRRRDNIKFLDTIHPQIGVMNDLSQTGGAYVDFNYRYMYLSLPLLFSQQLSGKKKPNTVVHFVYGASASVLIKHDIRAVLRGFSTRGGEKVHILDNSASQPERINFNLNAGFRIENIVYGKHTWIFAQPEILIPALNSNRGSERARLFAAAIQIGLLYKPFMDKKEDQ